MGHISSKIYRVKIFLALFVIISVNISLFAKEDIGGVFYRVVFPFYQDNGDLPLVILRCDKAKPIGIRVEMEGVTLEWIGESIKDIKGVIKTPSAVYDKNTQKVFGNEKITYRSSAMDLDGVGFDIDQVKQLIHIRSDVKVVLKSRLKQERGMHRANTGKGKISIAKSRAKMQIERIVAPEAEKEKSAVEEVDAQDSVRGSNFEWSSLFWFVILIISVTVVIGFLHRKQVKKCSK